MSRILRVVCVIVIVAMTYAHFSDAFAICNVDHQCFNETYDPAASPPILPEEISEVNDRLFTMIYDSIERGDYLTASLVLPQIGDPYMGDLSRIQALGMWRGAEHPSRQHQTYTSASANPITVSVSANIARWVRVLIRRDTWRFESIDDTHRISVAGTLTDEYGEQSCFADTAEHGELLIVDEDMGGIRTGMITLSHIHIPPLLAEGCFSHPDCFFYIPDAVGAFASTRGADIERRLQMRQFLVDSETWGNDLTMEHIGASVDLLQNIDDARHEMLAPLRNRIETCFVDLGGPSH